MKAADPPSLAPSGPAPAEPREPRSYAATASHVLVVVAIVLVAIALVVVREALLLAFAAAIIAALLEAGSAPLRRLSGMSHSAALSVVVPAIVAVIVGVGWLVGAQVHAQVVDLLDQLPSAIRSAETLARHGIR